MTDENFTRLLPKYLQRASRLYFTPVHIAVLATKWLTETGKMRVLDIGAGVGKFCIVGAKHSDSHFYGIEYRRSLAKLANHLIDHFEIDNATILNQNITQVDFTGYDSFYFFNPYFENLMYAKRLNDEVELSGQLYGNYFKYTEQQLNRTKPGTRLVTFHGNNFEVPWSFEKIKESSDSTLKLWIKK